MSDLCDKLKKYDGQRLYNVTAKFNRDAIDYTRKQGLLQNILVFQN